MSQNYLFRSINLQLFADGAAAGDGGTDAGGAKAEGTLATSTQAETPLEDIKYGKQETAPVAAAQKEETATEQKLNPDSEFEKLIKGDYKEQFEKRIQDAVGKRLKASKETVDKFNALTPTLELLSKKYGVKADDLEALNKAIEEDDTFYENEALEKGMSVEQLKSIRKMERENAELKRQMHEKEVAENADKLYASWMDQADKTKEVYPAFDLEAEMQNEKFIELLRSNIDVRTAYEVIHKDEIIPAAMAFTAGQVEQKITNKIIANGKRPVENGNNSQSPATVKADVSQLSDADLDEINRRVARGERIVF